MYKWIKSVRLRAVGRIHVFKWFETLLRNESRFGTNKTKNEENSGSLVVLVQ